MDALSYHIMSLSNKIEAYTNNIITQPLFTTTLQPQITQHIPENKKRLSHL
jgi:hypothetical protein